MVPATISVISNQAFGEAAEQRKLGRLDDARSTAARLMTIARRLVREYPDSAYSYYVLSVAHNVIKKNAYRTHDDSLVEEALSHAVEAGQRAVRLDPDLIEARRLLDKLSGDPRQHQGRSEGGGYVAPIIINGHPFPPSLSDDVQASPQRIDPTGHPPSRWVKLPATRLGAANASARLGARKAGREPRTGNWLPAPFGELPTGVG